MPIVLAFMGTVLGAAGACRKPGRLGAALLVAGALCLLLALCMDPLHPGYS